MTQAAEKTELAFDAESHIYTLGKQKVPSVTQVINSILPGWQADEWYMQKGTAMHHGCRLMDEGRLDRTSVSFEIAGRLDAWEKFRAECPGKILAAEHPMAHPLFRFAGTLDRVFVVNDAVTLVDIKSSISPQAKVQLGAYKTLWDTCSSGHIITKGVAVELSDDGSYRTLWLDRKELELCARTFLACLTIYNFKQKERLS
jgi:hypothetical protein